MYLRVNLLRILHQIFLCPIEVRLNLSAQFEIIIWRHTNILPLAARHNCFAGR